MWERVGERSRTGEVEFCPFWNAGLALALFRLCAGFWMPLPNQTIPGSAVKMPCSARFRSSHTLLRTSLSENCTSLKRTRLDPLLGSCLMHMHPCESISGKLSSLHVIATKTSADIPSKHCEARMRVLRQRYDIALFAVTASEVEPPFLKPLDSLCFRDDHEAGRNVAESSSK